MSFSIVGTGSSAPKTVLSNAQLSTMVDTTDAWIVSRTGIKERRVSVEETITDFATQAAQRALADAKIGPHELDMIVCSTIRGDYITPALSCMVQKNLGATCPAFDINAACSGFLYALDMVQAYMDSGKAQRVLIVCAEQMSAMVDWTDRASCVLFGDGAGAVVVQKDPEALAVFQLTCKGDETVLQVPHVVGNAPFAKHVQRASFVQMKGQEVYKFAVQSLCNDLESVAQKAGITLEQIDYVLPHQANLRILEGARQRLPIPEEKFCTNIDRYGNTSSASIPILLDELNKQHLFKKGDILALCAFGGGLTSGAGIILWK